MPVKPVPDGYHTATPYLICRNATAALDFYASAFGATELMRMPGPDGVIGHAEIKIGNSPIMLADEFPQMGAVSPQTVGGTGSFLMLYVEDCDATFAKAISLGAKELQPLSDKFYGDRSGSLEDPFGHRWTIATHVEDVPPDELAKRAAEAMSGTGENGCS